MSRRTQAPKHPKFEKRKTKIGPSPPPAEPPRKSKFEDRKSEPTKPENAKFRTPLLLENRKSKIDPPTPRWLRRVFPSPLPFPNCEIEDLVYPLENRPAYVLRDFGGLAPKDENRKSTSNDHHPGKPANEGPFRRLLRVAAGNSRNDRFSLYCWSVGGAMVGSRTGSGCPVEEGGDWC